MLKYLLFLLALVASSQNLNAQEFQPIGDYLNSTDISQEAKDFYTHDLDVNTSDEVYSIIDSLFTENEDARTFYVFLACQMLADANPDLQKKIGIVCGYLLEQHPMNVTAALFTDRQDDDCKMIWVQIAAGEIKKNCKEGLMDCFKYSRTTALQNCNANHKERLETMYNLIRRELGLFGKQ